MKTTRRYHLIPVRMTIKKKTNVGEDVEEREPLYSLGDNVDCCSHYVKQYGDSSKSKQLSDDSAIPLLGIHSKETKYLEKISALPCSLQHYLHTVVKTWKCPLMDE